MNYEGVTSVIVKNLFWSIVIPPVSTLDGAEKISLFNQLRNLSTNSYNKATVFSDKDGKGSSRRLHNKSHNDLNALAKSVNTKIVKSGYYPTTQLKLKKFNKDRQIRNRLFLRTYVESL